MISLLIDRLIITELSNVKRLVSSFSVQVSGVRLQPAAIRHSGCSFDHRIDQISAGAVTRPTDCYLKSEHRHPTPRSWMLHSSPTAASICCRISSSGVAASTWLTSSSSVKCFRKIAPVGHFELQSPSPLQRTGLTTAFLP